MGSRGILKFYDKLWNCWIVYKYRATVNSDWAWEWEVFTRSFSVMHKMWLAGICVIIKGRPHGIEINNQWRKEMLLLESDDIEFDTKYENLVKNDNYNCFAITNGDIARFWDEKRELCVNKIKARDIINGNGDKWEDEDYDLAVREEIAKFLKIPTINVTCDMIWGYSCEIFHLTCAVFKNITKGNYLLTFVENEWLPNEIIEFSQTYGLAATTQQHVDWMNNNPTRERNVLFKYSSNGHGYKKIINSMPIAIVKCGQIVHKKIGQLFEQFTIDGKQNDFLQAEMWIKTGDLVNFGVLDQNNNNNFENSDLSDLADNNDNYHLSDICENDDIESDVLNNNNNSNNNNNDNDNENDGVNDPNQVINEQVVNAYVLLAKFAIRYVFCKYIQEVLYYMWKSKFDKQQDNSTPAEIVKMQKLAKKAGWIALQGDETLVSLVNTVLSVI